MTIWRIVIVFTLIDTFSRSLDDLTEFIYLRTGLPISASCRD